MVSAPQSIYDSARVCLKEGRVHSDVLYDLPPGFGQSEIHEAQMLESVIMDVPFQGDLDAIMPFVERQAPRPVSPETHAARELREQQDLEFEESQRRDREKQLAAMERERLQKEAAALEEQRKRQEAESLTQKLNAKASSLPEEPSEDALDSILVVIKLPNGARFCRRFSKRGPVSALFDFIDVETNKTAQDQVEMPL